MDALQWMGAVRIECSGVVWIIVMFYQLFGLSFWRHPFTAEHPLVSKWSGMIHFSKSDEETNSSTSLMEYIFSSFFIFRWTIPLTTTFTCYKSILYISSGSWFWLDGCWFHFGFFSQSFSLPEQKPRNQINWALSEITVTNTTWCISDEARFRRVLQQCVLVLASL